MSSRRSGSSSSSPSSRPHGRVSSTAQKMIDSLTTHRINTLTSLCAIERHAATTSSPVDALAFRAPITSSFHHYITSNSFLTELRTLTPSYPISAAIVADAYARVQADPDSNRSWNAAWLCLVKMRDDGMVGVYAAAEAGRREMWGGREPEGEEVDQLAACFEYEWTNAIETMLRHWTNAPTWY